MGKCIVRIIWKKCIVKIIFVIPDMSWLYDYKSQFSLGILYLSSILKKDDWEVEIFDSNVDLVETIPKADVYGFSTIYDTYSSVINLARHIRSKYQDSLLIAGGVDVTTEAFKFLNDFDCLFIGESEDLIKEFNWDFKYGNVRKFYRQNYPVDITNLLPDRSILTDEYIRTSSIFANGKIYSKGGATSIMFSRGCPSNCIFCCSPKLYKRRVRFHSVCSIRNEIISIIENYDIHQFRIQDDTFTLNKSFLEQFEEQTKDLSIFYRCSTRADAIDKEIAKLLFDSGCKEVGIGIEAADNNILRILGKQETVLQMENAISILKSYSIEIRCFFMIGTPFDTKELMYKNIDFIERNGIAHNTVANFIPYPGTEIYDKRSMYGIIGIKENPCMNIASHIKLSPNIICKGMKEREHIKIMKIFYDYLLEKEYIT